MWCQNCNIEFEDGFTVCLNCGNKLVDYKPIVDDVSGEDETPDLPRIDDADEKLSLQLLVSFPDEEGADELVENLKGINIPALKKASDDGYDVFVQASEFQAALEFVSRDIPDDDESILSDEELMREFGDMEFSDGTDVDPDEIAKNV